MHFSMVKHDIAIEETYFEFAMRVHGDSYYDLQRFVLVCILFHGLVSNFRRP